MVYHLAKFFFNIIPGEEIILLIMQAPAFITKNSDRFFHIFNKPQLRHFSEYLTGLVISGNKTIDGCLCSVKCTIICYILLT